MAPLIPYPVTWRLALAGLARAFWLALLLCAAAVSADPGPRDISLRQDGDDLVVSNPFYTLRISTQRGGRIVSCISDDRQMTRLCPDGRGGLLGEIHTDEMPCHVRQWRRDGSRIVLDMETDAGDLRVLRELTFRADRPWFTVRFTFQNHSQYTMAGAAAPALRHLVEPQGQKAAGRQFYCMDSGRGAEVMPAEDFMARLHMPAARAGWLRWMAVAEPASRRALGFSLPHGGCRPLRPERTDRGGMTFGWAYPPLPAGHQLASTLLVVPLDGFSAVTGLGDLFAADSLVTRDDAGLTSHLQIMPLEDGLEQVSLITRAFDARGQELDPFDPVLFDDLDALQVYREQVTAPESEVEPAWLVHELYSRGQSVGRFAVPVGRAESDVPDGSAAAEMPTIEPIDETSSGAPTLPSPVAEGEGPFVLWRFDGQRAPHELKDLEIVLTRAEKRTVFLGLRALQPVETFRLALAGLAPRQAGAHTLPPAAAYLWRVNENGPSGPYLTPLTEMSLAEGTTTWLAVTVDAAPLAPGRYTARLVATAGDHANEISLSARVLDRPGPDADAFGLWYLADAPTPAARAKLLASGVSGLTLPESTEAEAVANIAPPSNGGDAAMSLLAFGAGDGALPPSLPSPGSTLTGLVHPVWLLRAWGAPPGALSRTLASGYVPAVLCDRLTSLPEHVQSADGRTRMWLVKDGCAPGKASELVTAGVMNPSDPVWMYLDVDGMDWQQAAIEVRSALWAAAWQGLAGVAVEAPPPLPQVDRQLAIWHILRDARSEVALWRQMRDTARRALDATAMDSPNDLKARRLLLFEGLDQMVGTEPDSDLVVTRRRMNSREVYRVTGPTGQRQPSLSRFEACRRKVMGLYADVADASRSVPPEGLYWRGIPLVQDGVVQWSIMAGEGEAAWKTALALQRAIQDQSGRTVNLSRAFVTMDDEPQAAAAVLWVVAGEEDGQSLPERLRDALAERGGAALVTVRLDDGRMAAVLRNGRSLSALLGTFRASPRMYPGARDVR